jgi:hypothetical protein
LASRSARRRYRNALTRPDRRDGSERYEEHNEYRYE